LPRVDASSTQGARWVRMIALEAHSFECVTRNCPAKWGKALNPSGQNARCTPPHRSENLDRRQDAKALNLEAGSRARDGLFRR
jgi:hypothetical protein